MGCLLFLLGKTGMFDIVKHHRLNASFAQTSYLRFASSPISSYQEEAAEVVKQLKYQRSHLHLSLSPQFDLVWQC